MSLDDIKNDLYEKSQPGERIENKSDYGWEKINLVGNNSKDETADLWAEKTEGLGKEEKKAVKIGAIIIGIILFLILSTVVFFLVRRSMFAMDKMALEISGSDKTQSGKLVAYEINYKNNNWGSLKNVVLKVAYPETFKPENNLNFEEKTPTEGIFNIGLMKRHTEGKIIFQGKTFNPKGALMYIKANLVFRPSNSKQPVEMGSQIGVNILPSSISLEILAPQNIPAGNAIDYQINCKNSGAEEIGDLTVKIDYPEQFDFSNANPPASEGKNFWKIENLLPGETKKIVVSGKLNGERNSVKSAKVYAGFFESGNFVAFNEERVETRIIASPLVIAQRVNDSAEFIANSGDNLQFRIDYKNSGNTGLRDVIITEKLDSPILDYATLKIEGGSFDTDKKIITWKASGIPSLRNLEAGKSGKILFGVKVKNIFPISSSADKNFVISTEAKIDSPDIPTPIHSNKFISGNKIDIKVNSKLVLNVSGYYTDKDISNSGPIPPKIGKETTYTLHWKVYNIFNDIREAKVISILPAGVEMTGKIFPENSKIEYNQRDNSIVWNIGNVSAGTGALSPPLEASFQVKIKPSPNQEGEEVDLLGKSIITAGDLFTGQDLKFFAKEKTTNLIEDKTAIGKHKVVE